MATWEKLGTVKKGNQWFYQLRNTATGKITLKPCQNLNKKSKEQHGKKKRGKQSGENKAKTAETPKKKKRKDPWADEIRKARKALAKSARMMNGKYT